MTCGKKEVKKDKIWLINNNFDQIHLSIRKGLINLIVIALAMFAGAFIYSHWFEDKKVEIYHEKSDIQIFEYHCESDIVYGLG